MRQFRSVKLSTLLLLVTAGIALGATSTLARGTDLRSEQALDLKGLVLARANQIEQFEADNLETRTEVDALITQKWSAKLVDLRSKLNLAKESAGFEPIAGAGLIVTLDDAPYDPAGELGSGIDPNWLLIHQEDIQVVINALFAGGAEAVSLMDQRIVSVSDIKCVGSTLLVNGRVYSPPFVIKAVGPTKQMQESLANDPGVWFIQDMATTFNLFFGVKTSYSIDIPGYNTIPVLEYAKPIK